MPLEIPELAANEGDRQEQVLSVWGNWNLHVLLLVIESAAIFKYTLTTSLDGKLRHHLTQSFHTNIVVKRKTSVCLRRLFQIDIYTCIIYSNKEVETPRISINYS